MDADQLETQSKNILKGMAAAHVEAPPFLKARVMARLQSSPKGSMELWFWRFLAAASTAACVALALIYQGHLKASEKLMADAYSVQKSYVLQIDLTGERLQDARVAEMELPDGVKFVSKAHPEIGAVRNMRLPIPAVNAGRSRLPFVVSSETTGRKELKVKIYDSNGAIIQERVLSVNFVAQKNSSIL